MVSNSTGPLPIISHAAVKRIVIMPAAGAHSVILYTAMKYRIKMSSRHTQAMIQSLPATSFVAIPVVSGTAVSKIHHTSSQIGIVMVSTGATMEPDGNAPVENQGIVFAE